MTAIAISTDGHHYTATCLSQIGAKAKKIPCFFPATVKSKEPVAAKLPGAGITIAEVTCGTKIPMF